MAMYFRSRKSAKPLQGKQATTCLPSIIDIAESEQAKLLLLEYRGSLVLPYEHFLEMHTSDQTFFNPPWRQDSTLTWFP